MLMFRLYLRRSQSSVSCRCYALLPCCIVCPSDHVPVRTPSSFVAACSPPLRRLPFVQPQPCRRLPKRLGGSRDVARVACAVVSVGESVSIRCVVQAIETDSQYRRRRQATVPELYRPRVQLSVRPTADLPHKECPNRASSGGRQCLSSIRNYSSEWPEACGTTQGPELTRGQFINEEPQKDDDEGDDPELSKERSSSIEEELQQSYLEGGREGSNTHSHSQSLDVELPQWEAGGPSSQNKSHTQPTTTMFSDNDESAVAGLLALGTSINETMAPSLSLSVFAISPPTKQPSVYQETTPAKYPDQSMTFSPRKIANAAPSNFEISTTQALKLLRHYRYEVAPWVSPPSRFTDEKENSFDNVNSWTFVISDSYSEYRACS